MLSLNKFVSNLTVKYLISILAMLFLSGCGDFFADKPTEIEARSIIRDISQVKESKHIKNKLPELYTEGPKRIRVKDGVKLFYFTRQHTVENLAGLIEEQLGNKTSKSGPTNQLIIHCSDDKNADKVIEFLSMVDVPPIQVNIDCIILERFGDVAMDRETTIFIENFLGERIILGGKTSNRLPLGSNNYLLPNFPGASLRESARSNFGLDFGYWNKAGIAGHQLRAVIDMLVSRGYLKILLNPTIETVNGKTATVEIRDHAPIERIVTTESGSPYALTEYQWVKDSLTVTPSVFADGSIGLKTSITIGSKSKPEGVIQASIITERSIEVEENRIKPGMSLIIGGMRKSEKRDVVRGVPFLKDIPIIGALFSSKDFEEKATEIIFILTPSISSGGVDHAEMIKDIRKKHASPKLKIGLGEVITDPFGTRAYTRHIEQKAAEAETNRIMAELKAEDAKKEVLDVKDKLYQLEMEAEQARLTAQEAKQQARQAKLDAEKAKKERQQQTDPNE